jgi:hypothetical protein
MKRLLAMAALSLVAFAAAAEDSPLVAAAKKAKRGKSKSVVITDDMVKKSTGHVTSTTVVYTPTVPPKSPQTAEMKMLEARAAEKAAAEKKAADAKAAEDEKQKKLARQAAMADAAENYEDGYDEMGADPAQLERELPEIEKKEEPKKP